MGVPLEPRRVVRTGINGRGTRTTRLSRRAGRRRRSLGPTSPALGVDPGQAERLRGFEAGSLATRTRTGFDGRVEPVATVDSRDSGRRCKPGAFARGSFGHDLEVEARRPRATRSRPVQSSLAPRWRSSTRTIRRGIRPAFSLASATPSTAATASTRPRPRSVARPGRPEASSRASGDGQPLRARVEPWLDSARRSGRPGGRVEGDRRRAGRPAGSSLIAATGQGFRPRPRGRPVEGWR